MKLSVSYKMTLTRSWGNETLALGNKIQSVQKWLRAENGYDLATAVPAFNYILLRGIYRITFDLCDMGKKLFTIIENGFNFLFSVLWCPTIGCKFVRKKLDK